MSAAAAFSKDSEPETRLAACRAGGSLVAAEATQKLPAGSALAQLLPVFLALVGPGQTSDVQRQQMQARSQLKNHGGSPSIRGTGLLHGQDLLSP